MNLPEATDWAGVVCCWHRTLDLAIPACIPGGAAISKCCSVSLRLHKNSVCIRTVEKDRTGIEDHLLRGQPRIPGSTITLVNCDLSNWCRPWANALPWLNDSRAACTQGNVKETGLAEVDPRMGVMSASLMNTSGRGDVNTSGNETGLGSSTRTIEAVSSASLL